MPPPFFPFKAHHTLNSNTCCCSALISSYMLYANTVSHHRVLLGSVSRVGLMVGCFKNSLSVRTENNSNTPPCIISQPSCGHPANYLLRSIGMFACYLERTLLWEQILLPGLYTWLHHVKITIYVLAGQFFFFHATCPLFSIHWAEILSHLLLFSSKSPRSRPTSWTAALRKAWRGETTRCVAAR